MSKKISTTSIGLFIVTGLALGVTGLLLFSSSRLFTHTRDVIVYFDESLNGLHQGAPVKYRGVTIGSVKRVMVHFNQATNDYAMPVVLEMREDLLKERLGEPVEVFTDRALEMRIKLGLRAMLQTESLVTGVLYVELEPDTAAPPPDYHQLQKVYPEIPTVPTEIQQLFNNLASLDIKGIETRLNALLDKLDTTIGSLSMGQINRGITNLLGSIERLVTSPDITNSLAALGPTLEEYRQVGEKLNKRVDPLAAGITNTLAEANRALAQVRGAGENLRILLAPDAPLRNDLDQALQQLANASQSISALAEFLKQNPNALIVGREILPKKQ